MRDKRERGQGIVELAIVLPILILLVLGALDLGRGFSTRIALANAAREAVFVASLTPSVSQAGLQAIVDGEMGGTVDGPVTVTRTGLLTAGTPVTIALENAFAPTLSGLFGAPTLPVRASATMVVQ